MSDYYETDSGLMIPEQVAVDLALLGMTIMRSKADDKKQRSKRRVKEAVHG